MNIYIPSSNMSSPHESFPPWAADRNASKQPKAAKHTPLPKNKKRGSGSLGCAPVAIKPWLIPSTYILVVSGVIELEQGWMFGDLMASFTLRRETKPNGIHISCFLKYGNSMWLMKQKFSNQFEHQVRNGKDNDVQLHIRPTSTTLKLNRMQSIWVIKSRCVSQCALP